MKQSDIDHFFATVAERTRQPAEIYLTGGVAAWYYGGVRPTQDIDFALTTAGDWNDLATLIQELSRELKIPVQFSEDISRWGMIGVTDFTVKAKRYKRFGRIQVFLLDPLIWSIGKMTRYTSDDVNDMEVVFKKCSVTWEAAIKIWVQALKESPRSSAQSLFIRKVTDFLKHSGPKIWGRKFDAAASSKQFKQLIAE